MEINSEQNYWESIGRKPAITGLRVYNNAETTIFSLVEWGVIENNRTKGVVTKMRE
jgi:hypothetical protein